MNNCYTGYRILRFASCVTLLACLTLFSLSCLAQVGATYGEPLAAVSPDGRWFVLAEAPNGHPRGTWLRQTAPLASVLPTRISGGVRAGFIATVWSPDSKKFLTCHGGMIPRPTDSLELHCLSDNSTRKILTPGGASSACFSPDGRLVAFETGDLKLPVYYLAVWITKERGANALRYFAFKDDIEGFAWLNNHSLLVITPTGRYTPKYENQKFYRIDVDTRKITAVPNRVTTKVGAVWPYLDGAKKILAIAGSKRLFAEAHKTGYERIIEIDPEAGTEKQLGKTFDMLPNFWMPLPSGSGQTFLSINVFHKDQQVVYTRKIDGAHGAVGEPVQWNVTGEPSVDSHGRIFGWLGKDAGYASPVKSP